MEIVTSWQTLFILAHEAGQAKLHGTHEQATEADKRHKDYEHLCLIADRMIHLPDIKWKDI